MSGWLNTSCRSKSWCCRLTIKISTWICCKTQWEQRTILLCVCWDEQNKHQKGTSLSILHWSGLRDNSSPEATVADLVFGSKLLTSVLVSIRPHKVGGKCLFVGSNLQQKIRSTKQNSTQYGVTVGSFIVLGFTRVGPALWICQGVHLYISRPSRFWFHDKQIFEKKWCLWSGETEQFWNIYLFHMTSCFYRTQQHNLNHQVLKLRLINMLLIKATDCKKFEINK